MHLEHSISFYSEIVHKNSWKFYRELYKEYEHLKFFKKYANNTTFDFFKLKKSLFIDWDIFNSNN